MTTPMSKAELAALIKRLGFICRYNGAVKRHYSVAEHTSLGLEKMKLDGRSVDEMRAFFVHDMPEALMGLGDLTRPVKHALPTEVARYVAALELGAFVRINTLLDFPDPDSAAWEAAKEYDNLMAVAEREAVALVGHDSPSDYDPKVHGFVVRRIREHNRVPARSLVGWANELWPWLAL